MSWTPPRKPSLDDPLSTDIGWYTLDENGDPVPAKTYRDLQRNEHRGEEGLWRVGFTEIGDPPLIHVSTVFLGLDHDHYRPHPLPAGYQPLVFETMTFQSERKRNETYGFEFHEELGDQRRYRTRGDAIKGHARQVAIAERLVQEHYAKMREKAE